MKPRPILTDERCTDFLKKFQTSLLCVYCGQYHSCKLLKAQHELERGTIDAIQ